MQSQVGYRLLLLAEPQMSIAELAADTDRRRRTLVEVLRNLSVDKIGATAGWAASPER